MKGSVTATLGVAIAGVFFAGSAWAQAPMGGGPAMAFGEHRPPFERALGGPGEHGRWWNNPKLVERLKLTDAQRKAMDDTLQQHREKLVDLRGNLEKTELEMEPLMKEDQPNESRILAQIDKVAQARAELEKANARFLLAIRSKLTPDQWKLMEADRVVHEREMEGRGNWRPGSRHRPLPPPIGDGLGAPLPPGGPQSLEGGPWAVDEPAARQEGAGVQN